VPVDGLLEHNGHLNFWLVKFPDHTMPDIADFTVKVDQVMQNTEEQLQNKYWYMPINSQVATNYIKPCSQFFISDFCYEPRAA
jgi:hypothetical protein